MKLVLRFIPMVVIMGMIFFLSHQPGDVLRLPGFFGLDKLLHLMAYGALAAAFLFALHPYARETHRTLAVFVVLLFCLLFGISDEFHQSFVPGRSVSAWDVAADFCGALLAVWVWHRKTAAGR